jgi:hypothetical protein
MNKSFASPLMIAAVLAAAPTLAAVPASSTSQSSGSALQDTSSSQQGTFYGSMPTHGRFGWAGVGLYHTSFSVDTPFGTFSEGDTHFGFNIGGALDLFQITPDLPLAVFGNVALAFGGNFTIFPISVGAAVHYDKLPVQLFGGLSFTIMPASDIGETPLGLGIWLMGAYPLPQIRPGMAAMAQFQYHFLDDGFSLLVFDVGLSMAF